MNSHSGVVGGIGHVELAKPVHLVCCPTFISGDVDMSKWQTVGLWWMVVRRSFAFQVLVCIGPLMTGQLLPVAHAKQANSVSLAGWWSPVSNEILSTDCL